MTVQNGERINRHVIAQADMPLLRVNDCMGVYPATTADNDRTAVPAANAGTQGYRGAQSDTVSADP
jgi:hypothetical protein